MGIFNFLNKNSIKKESAADKYLEKSDIKELKLSLVKEFSIYNEFDIKYDLTEEKKSLLIKNILKRFPFELKEALLSGDKSIHICYVSLNNDVPRDLRERVFSLIIKDLHSTAKNLKLNPTTIIANSFRVNVVDLKKFCNYEVILCLK